MARSVLRKSPDGDSYELVCDPESEAAIYAEPLTLNLWPLGSTFGGPVKLIGCDPEHGRCRDRSRESNARDRRWL
jgi:hypothetical protein